MLRVRNPGLGCWHRQENRSGVSIACVYVCKSSEIATRMREKERESDGEKGRVINLFIQLRISVSRGNQVWLYEPERRCCCNGSRFVPLNFLARSTGRRSILVKMTGSNSRAVRGTAKFSPSRFDPPIRADRSRAGGIHFPLFGRKRSSFAGADPPTIWKKTCGDGSDDSIPACNEMCNYVIDTYTYIYASAIGGREERRL